MRFREVVAKSYAAVSAIGFLGVAMCASGQVESGRFVGHITDAQGAIVQNATITATNVGTNIGQTVSTNSLGDYVITPVAAGVYTLSVTAPGFATATASKIEV